MQKETNTQTVYEIGFHLISRLAEEEVPGQVEEIKSILSKTGAELISEEFPTLTDLAYTISKTVAGTKEDFDTAYFGWIKFEAEPASLEDIDEAVRTKPEVLRFIIVKTLREDTRIAPLEEGGGEREDESGEIVAKAEAPAPAQAEEPAQAEAPAKESAEEPKEASSDDVDKAIDNLVS